MANILPKFRMSLGPGGYIRQAIVKDEYPSDTWDLDRSVFLNVSIVKSTSYRRITGFSPPPASLDAAAYAERDLPYFIDDAGAEPAIRNDGKGWEAQSPYHKSMDRTRRRPQVALWSWIMLVRENSRPLLSSWRWPGR
jgi:hypothetical protein